VYLAIGFAAGVTGNVLHVDPAGLFWTRYAVAAVPPVAAMLALAALLRQAYRLATDPVPVAAPKSAPSLNGRAHASASPGRTRARSRGRTRSAPVDGDAAEREFMAELASGAVPSIRQIRARLHVGQDRARVLHEHTWRRSSAPELFRPRRPNREERPRGQLHEGGHQHVSTTRTRSRERRTNTPGHGGAPVGPPAQRRPVLPAWLRDRQSRRHACRPRALVPGVTG
jgi:hypothetical protein